MTFKPGDYVFRRKETGNKAFYQAHTERNNVRSTENSNILLEVKYYIDTLDNISFDFDGVHQVSKGYKFRLATEKEIKEYKLKHIFIK
jgi:hypothetical protein